MQRLLVIAAASLVIIVPSLSVAAPSDSTSATTGRPNSLAQGTWAMQFSVDGYFNSAGVFFKKHLKPNHALRLGATFSVDTRAGDISTDTSAVVVEKGTREVDQFWVHIELISQRYANVTGAAHVFYGIGPFFEYREYRDEEKASIAGDDALRIRDEESYRVGGVFVVGAEWFASRALSLDIEYSVAFGYSSFTNETTYDYYDFFSEPAQHRAEELTGWFVDAGNTVRLALGIYF